jgi:hypothetical protein
MQREINGKSVSFPSNWFGQDKLFNISISLLQEIKFSFQKAKQISQVA